VTLHAVAGLVALNLLILVAGLPVLWAVSEPLHWWDLARLGGLAYMLGVAVLGSVLVFELVVGVPFGLAALIVTAVVVAATGAAIGVLLGRPPPRRRPLDPAAWRVRQRPVTALGVVVSLLYLEVIFRLARLAPLLEWDSMAFWGPKGKAIYFFAGLDQGFFTSLPGPSYPPLVPALEAAAFASMGSADAVTLHLMFWFLLAGFIAAVVGVLAPRVSPVVLWPGTLVVIFTPAIADGPIAPAGDALLDYFVALATLLIALWLLERRRSYLVLAAAFLAGAMLTKREGLLLAACVVAAGAAASLRERRSMWVPLGAAGLGAFLVSSPWRIWFESHAIGGEGPETGLFGFVRHLDRGGPALRLTLSVLFDWDLWYLVMPLAVVAVGVAVLARARVLALYVGCFVVLAILAFTWTTWSFPSLPITKNGALNPIGRLSASLVFTLAGLLPLLLQAGLSSTGRPGREGGR
jgi:hypothetical protein